MSMSLQKSNGSPVKPPFNEIGTIIGVNFKFLHAVLLGVVAWWIWPSDPKWWGLGMIAAILAAASFGLMISGLRSAIKLHSAKKRWAALQALGNAPKNARLAGKHDLHKRGMN